MKRLLSGNEAVARAAWEAGAKVGSGYPGTPSTEILEAFAPYPDVYAEWAPNEKVGLDVAVGAAYAGRRAFATMKHVGLNVASDAFFAVAMTGIEAGLVVISADDPSMHSSQNEQDNRQFAKFARIPCLDPSDSQDAHDLTLAAFDLSEQFDTPVLLRLTTRVCHTSSPVELGEQREQRPEPGKYPRNLTKYCMVPANAKKRHPAIEERVARIAAFAETFAGNRIEWRSSDLGIITGGVAYNYAREVFPEASVLKLGMVYPLPHHLISDFASRVQKVIVLEELDPFIEDQIRLMGIALYRPQEIMPEPPYPVTKQIFPIAGELDPAVVRQSGRQAGLLPASENDGLALSTSGLPIRPPVLCPGCPHRSSFYVLHKLGVPVNGDIGCYTLGMVQPLDALHTVGCMGASVG
ncbi:MAG: indolepyruvate ferredoxin oxidoreductase subunit alpha, partial [Bellilinea sp.]